MPVCTAIKFLETLPSIRQKLLHPASCGVSPRRPSRSDSDFQMTPMRRAFSNCVCGCSIAPRRRRRSPVQLSFLRHKGWTRQWIPLAGTLWVVAVLVSSLGIRARATPMQSSFERRVLAPALPEAPFNLRFFAGAVKTNSRGEIITGFDDDPVKKLVGAETAGNPRRPRTLHEDSLRRGLLRRPARSGHPHRSERSGGEEREPALAVRRAAVPQLAQRDRGEARRHKLYVTLPAGKATRLARRLRRHATRRVLRWIDLRVAGQPRGTRPGRASRSRRRTPPFTRSLRRRRQRVRQLRQRDRQRDRQR